MSEQLVDTLKNMSDPELAKYQSGWKPGCESYLLADREWQRRERIKQHEFNKKQIELQHDFNQELLTKQIAANRSFLIITVIATIFAAILGAVAGGYAQYAIPKYLQKTTEQKPQETTQHHTENMKAASPSEKTHDKAPSLPPLK